MGLIVVGLGIAVLFQFVILRHKWNKGLYLDAIIDVVMLIILNALFGGSQLGVVSATAGSTLISLWLMKFPIRGITLPSVDDIKDHPITALDRRMEAASNRLDRAMAKMTNQEKQ